MPVTLVKSGKSGALGKLGKLGKLGHVGEIGVKIKVSLSRISLFFRASQQSASHPFLPVLQPPKLQIRSSSIRPQAINAMVIHNGREHLTTEEKRLREDRKKIKVQSILHPLTHLTHFY